MAQKVNIELVDDLDGKTADSTVTFGLDGTTYEIDLSDKNAAKLRDALAPYVASGRRVTGQRSTSRRNLAAVQNGPKAAEVRAWATENGHEVPERGRIPAEVREAYDAAHAS